MIGLFSKSIYPRPGGSSHVTEELARCFNRDELFVVGGRPVWNRAGTAPRRTVNFHYLPSELNVLWRGDRFFASVRRSLLPLLHSRAVKLCRQYRCTHIIGTYPDDLYLTLACRVAADIGVPFSVYLHNTVYENKQGASRAIAQEAQREAFASAVNVFVISEGLRRHYSDAGVRRVSVVPHVYSEDVDFGHEVAAGPRGPGGPWRITLCGNFNQSNIEATRRVVETLGGKREFEIEFMTPVPELLLRQRGIATDRIARIGYAPGDEVLRRLHNSDVLVLTHGFTGGFSEVEYATIFPTRTLPMLLSGKPMLVHAPPHSFLAAFFREERCGLLVDRPDPSELLGAVRRLISDGELREELVSNARRVLQRFRGNAVKTYLLDVLESPSLAGGAPAR